MRAGRPRKYHSELERKRAKREQVKRWRLARARDKSESGLEAAIGQHVAQKRWRRQPRYLLKNEEKRRLAEALICAAGTMIEAMRRDEAAGLAGIDPGLAAQQISDWLERLPHKDWDPRLPLPQIEQELRKFRDTFAAGRSARERQSTTGGGRSGVKVEW